MCLAIDTKDNDFQCVHFINQLEDGKYQDNTWGWRYKQCEYYIIKEINLDEQEHIWDSLCECKRMLVNTNSTTFERFIFKIKAEKFI